MILPELKHELRKLMFDAFNYLHLAHEALELDAPTLPECLTFAAAKIAEMQLKYRGEPTE